MKNEKNGSLEPSKRRTIKVEGSFDGINSFRAAEYHK
jgi:hypothetical protein